MLRRSRGQDRSQQPDRPLLITAAHLSVPILYATRSAVSPTRFTNDATRVLLASPLLPCMHIAAAAGLLLAICWLRRPWHRAGTSVFSVVIWAFTTALLTEASFAHSPRGTLWSADLATITTLAAALMAQKWGVPRDDDSDGPG